MTLFCSDGKSDIRGHKNKIKVMHRVKLKEISGNG